MHFYNLRRRILQLPDVPDKFVKAIKLDGYELQQTLGRRAFQTIVNAGIVLLAIVVLTVAVSSINPDWQLWFYAICGTVAVLGVIGSTISYVIYRQLAKTQQLRRDIPDGRYREYFVTTNDYSGEIVLTTELFDYVQKADRLIEAKLRAVMAHPRLVELDKLLKTGLHSEVDIIARLEQKEEVLSYLQLELGKLGLHRYVDFDNAERLIDEQREVEARRLEERLHRIKSSHISA